MYCNYEISQSIVIFLSVIKHVQHALVPMNLLWICQTESQSCNVVIFFKLYCCTTGDECLCAINNWTHSKYANMPFKLCQRLHLNNCSVYKKLYSLMHPFVSYMVWSILFLLTWFMKRIRIIDWDWNANYGICWMQVNFTKRGPA